MKTAGPSAEHYLYFVTVQPLHPAFCSPGEKRQGLTFPGSALCSVTFHQEQATVHIPPLLRMHWARVRQGMASNLPLCAVSPVSDLDCCRLPRVLQFADKCVYGFRSHVCLKPPLVQCGPNCHTVRAERLILWCTRSASASPEDPRWGERS